MMAHPIKQMPYELVGDRILRYRANERRKTKNPF
jgi:hypothetical protein